MTRALLLCAALLIAAAPARGSPPSEARAAFARGAELQRAERFQDAIDAYRVGHAITPRPEFLFNIAQCERALGNKDGAIKAYRNYLRAAPDAANASNVEVIIIQLAQELAMQPASAPPAVSPVPSLAPSLVGSPPPPTDPPPTEPPASGPLPALASLASHELAPTDPAPTPTAVYERWWFWTAIGAAAIGGGTAAVVLTRRDGGAPTPSLGELRW